VTDLSTRDAYRDALLALLPTDPRLYCLDSDTGLFTGADLGGAADRYVNLGIAEHSLLGTAAGLAASGRIPYVTTMATFATTRALEAVKVDIAYPGLPVRIAGTHGGLAAGHLGPTHHALEDLGIMRMLPGFTVVVPADAAQTTAAVHRTRTVPGPVYLRLGRSATPPLPPGAPPFRLGELQALRHPTRPRPPAGPAGLVLTGRAGVAEVAILACGPYPVLAALGAADLLAARGIAASVHNVHTPHPLDVAGVLAATEPAAAVVTVEEHWRTGGLGSAIAEVLSEHAPRRLARIGVPDTFATRVGDQHDLLDHYGITDTRVADAALRLLHTTRPHRATGWTAQILPIQRRPS
jgi:transketolase